MTYLWVLAMMVELCTTKSAMGDEDEYDMEDTSDNEESGVRVARVGLENLVSVLLPARSGFTPAVSGMII
jgi:hypothetical protein